MAPNRGRRVPGQAGPHPRTLTPKGVICWGGVANCYSLLFSSTVVCFHLPPGPRFCVSPWVRKETLLPPSSLVICPFLNRRRLGLGLLACIGDALVPPNLRPGGALPRAGENDQCSCGSLGMEERGGYVALDQNPRESKVFALPAPSGASLPRRCSLSVPFLVPALACRGYISHFSLALAPAVPSQNRPSFACQAPWANVAATVVNGGELTRWCQQAVLTTGGTPLFCTICGHENHVSNTTTKSSFASPSFPYILMVVGKLQLLRGLLLLEVI